jgi:hypothetical protein
MMIEPDVTPPIQFFGRTLATPEKRLLLAVLEEAVTTHRRHALATDRRGRALLADVEAWFASEDTVWLCGFVAICDALGLEASYVRAGLGLGGRRVPSTRRPLYRFPFRRVSGTRHRTTGRAEGTAKRS